VLAKYSIISIIVKMMFIYESNFLM